MLIIFRFSPTIDANLCRSLYYAQSALYSFGVMVAEVILVSRAHAVWNRHRWIGVALFVGLLGVMVFLIVGQAKSLGLVTFIPSPAPSVTGCHPIKGSAIIVLNYISVMAFEFSMMILAILKGYQTRGNHSFLPVLHRDGVSYFIYLFALSLINVIALFHIPPGVGGALSTSYRNLHSIVSCRLILHLRMEYAKNILARRKSPSPGPSIHNSEPFGDREQLESLRFEQNSQEPREAHAGTSQLTRAIAALNANLNEDNDKDHDAYSMTSSLGYRTKILDIQ